jgi:hypothetical protein
MRIYMCNMCEFSIRIMYAKFFYMSCDYIFVYLLELVGCALSCFVVDRVSCSRMFLLSWTGSSFNNVFMSLSVV